MPTEAIPDPYTFFHTSGNPYFPLHLGNQWTFVRRPLLVKSGSERTADDFVRLFSSFLDDSLSLEVVGYRSYRQLWFAQIRETLFRGNKAHTISVFLTCADTNSINICDQPSQLFSPQCQTIHYAYPAAPGQHWSVNTVFFLPTTEFSRAVMDTTINGRKYHDCLVYFVQRGEWSGFDVLARGIGPVMMGNCYLSQRRP